MILYFSFVLFVVSGAVLAQVPLPANTTCATACKSNLTVTAKEFEGVWFFTQAVAISFLQESKCLYLNITNVNATFNTFSVVERLYSTDTDRTTDGYAYVPGDGTFDVKYSQLELPFHFEVVKKTSTQMIAVNCLECGFFSEEGAGMYVYFWSRVPYLTCNTMDEGIMEIEACGIPRGSLYAYDQSNCENICTAC